MPSRRHELLARAVPRLRKSRELDSPEAERARLETWHATLDRGFPTSAVPLFGRRYAVVREELPPAGFPSYTLTRRGQHARPGPSSTCTAAGSSGRSTRSRCGTPRGWPRRSARGW